MENITYSQETCIQLIAKVKLMHKIAKSIKIKD